MSKPRKLSILAMVLIVCLAIPLYVWELCLLSPGARMFFLKSWWNLTGQQMPVQAMTRCVIHKDLAIQGAAYDTLRELGPEAVPAVTPLLDSQDMEDRLVAARALAYYGSPAQMAVPRLIVLANGDENILVRRASLEALGCIDRDAKEFLPLLIKSVKDEDPGIRALSVRILGSLRRNTPEIIAALLIGLKDPMAGIRRDAADALEDLHPKDKEVILALIEALKDPGCGVRKEAAEALAAIGSDAKQAIPALVEALKDKVEGNRTQVVVTLGRMGPEAVPHLLKAFSQEKSLRMPIVRTLGNLGPEAKDALPVLRQALKDNNAELREAAKESIQLIEGKKKL